MKIYHCNGCDDRCELRTDMMARVPYVCIKTAKPINRNRGWREVKLFRINKDRIDYSKKFKIIKREYTNE